MNTVARLLHTLSSIPGWSVTTQHVDLLATEVGRLESELGDVREQHRELQAKYDQLKVNFEKLWAQSKPASPASNWREFSGLLWRSRSDGSYEPVPYCSRCERHPRMANIASLLFRCPACNFTASYCRPPYDLVPADR